MSRFNKIVRIGNLFSFVMLLGVKFISAALYRYEVKWLNHEQSGLDWNKVRLIVFLNHTSLFEPIFIRVVPNHFIWRISRDLVVPGADITLNRPILGKFYKSLLPGAVSISRKKDFTWARFLSRISARSIIAILPEGRMKRADGLDKHGKPMSVRGGIADILQGINSGKALFVYSGGLHHIQTPGQKLPRIFKTVKVNAEILCIKSYKASFDHQNIKEFKQKLMDDLNHRLEHLIPKDN